MIDYLMDRSKTEIDLIIAHIKSPAEMPLKDKRLAERLKRIKKADDLLYQWKVTKTVVDMMVTIFKEHDPKYSLATAYRDVADAKLIFSFDVNKKYERLMLAEWIKKTMLKAITGNKPDYRAYSSMAATLAKVLGLDREEIDIPDLSQLQPPDIEFGFFPDEMSANLPAPEELETILLKLEKPKRRKSSLGDIATLLEDDTDEDQEKAP